jgi:hypothetical protein
VSAASPLAVTFPVTKRPCQPQPLRAIPQPLEVLLDPVLHDLGAVPDVAQVGIDALHYPVGPCPSSRATVWIETGAPRFSVCNRAAQYMWRKAFERSSPAPIPARFATRSRSRWMS